MNCCIGSWGLQIPLHQLIVTRLSPRIRIRHLVFGDSHRIGISKVPRGLFEAGALGSVETSATTCAVSCKTSLRFSLCCFATAAMNLVCSQAQLENKNLIFPIVPKTTNVGIFPILPGTWPGVSPLMSVATVHKCAGCLPHTPPEGVSIKYTSQAVGCYPDRAMQPCRGSEANARQH